MRNSKMARRKGTDTGFYGKGVQPKRNSLKQGPALLKAIWKSSNTEIL